ncbi:MAG: restriction endonuclease subunit R [Cyanobacteria bacterium CRU_2_1]|nr:restriction endonuclease subunit R [Cyanobacteria bacterium RU_5_0]NJR60377.1 restriction endonuclease subunit R [Cyanobacteria bacterium CRU_2_1]
MVEVIQANELSLHQVNQKFNLQEVQDLQFFPEWQEGLVEPTEAEKQWLDRVKTDFLFLLEYPLHEEVVKMAVLALLLSLGGFFHYPFYPKAEAEIRITVLDEGEVVRGKIDLLILGQNLWVVVIESKNRQFSVDEALPQALSYMMGSPDPQKPVFGLATNGSHLIFIKLFTKEMPRYALSDEFSLRRRGNELYDVLSILRRLGEIVTL